ncbi:hypothetical protein L0P88_04170 [Muricauda sp. SCSIO 64092]|uniref:hypothetical protein n=1 Tax=Allomuricauda sp. SCSIO 64092 TaxID=2908842 RepID=UPI001FF63AF1|nr:hypothetical protein [Muricauda sp. SCSIO 64092]UOY07751.1 hypothetical protein L0P88_04170 [Muricauda sp. SCSIO 64092]
MMKRTLIHVQKDINALCQEIKKTLDDTSIEKRAKRLQMEAYGQRKATLDKERATLSGNAQDSVSNCKVGKSKPVPAYLLRRSGTEPKTTIAKRQNVAP